MVKIPSPPPLLVVAFGPFPRMPVNPSAEVARLMGADRALTRRLEQAPRVLVLRTAYESLDAVLAPALAAGPAAVLMIGVARRETRARVEARAVNRASRLFPDATGRASGRLALEPGGPALRRAGTLAALAHVALRRTGLDAGASIDAGRYLCNASYFRALAHGAQTLFLHIPKTAPSRPAKGLRPPRRFAQSQPARLAVAFREVADLLARRSRAERRRLTSTGARSAP